MRFCEKLRVIVLTFFADFAPLIILINLDDYSQEQHTLEIVGLTQVTEILRTTVQFYGMFVIVCKYPLRTKVVSLWLSE